MSIRKYYRRRRKYLGRRCNEFSNRIRPIRTPHRPHALGRPLIVSLTSYPKCFDVLEATLKTLLRQTVGADRLILWLAREDMAKLPTQIHRFERHGLEIRPCIDHGSYNKIIPSLETFPDAYIVTADDDIYYRSTWLEQLVETQRTESRDTIVCHRAHRITLDNCGRPHDYMDWDADISDTEPNPLTFPTGVGGVIYPPATFTREVLDSEQFMQLCPSADDVWLYWMATQNGKRARPVGNKKPLKKWSTTDDVGLWFTNRTENDRQIQQW